MLDSVKIQRRQSEIRQALAELVGKETPTEDETRSMTDLDAEYRTNETRYRASLISEDQERREAGEELETRDGREWADMMAGFEVRQVALALDEGRALSGQTAEIVTEMRERGGYRGFPVPYQALEMRAGETVASGTPDPIRTMPTIDRIFAESVAGRMGGQFISIPYGEVEYPVTTSSVAAGWQATETGDVAGPTVYAVTDRPLAPDHTLGITMKITRKAMKQSGDALEQAVRRDMRGAINVEMDKAVFEGSGSSGEPTGLLNISGPTSTAAGGVPTYALLLTEVAAFMAANAISNPGAVSLLMRPEVFAAMETTLVSGTATSDYYRTAFLLGGRTPVGAFPPNISVSGNALTLTSGTPDTSPAVLTTRTNGVAPFFVGAWGAIDVIRDPYSDAASGALRLTGLATMDVTISRAEQIRILTGLETS